MSARRRLEHDLIDRLEQDGHFAEVDDLRQGAMNESLNNPRLYSYEKDLAQYTYEQETVDQLKDLYVFHSRNADREAMHSRRKSNFADSNENPFAP